MAEKRKEGIRLFAVQCCSKTAGHGCCSGVAWNVVDPTLVVACPSCQLSSYHLKLLKDSPHMDCGHRPSKLEVVVHSARPTLLLRKPLPGDFSQASD